MLYIAAMAHQVTTNQILCTVRASPDLTLQSLAVYAAVDTLHELECVQKVAVTDNGTGFGPEAGPCLAQVTNRGNASTIQGLQRDKVLALLILQSTECTVAFSAPSQLCGSFVQQIIV